MITTNITTAAGDYYPTAISQGISYGMTLDLNQSPEFQALKDRIIGIEKQLCILQPNIALQEKYPALQEAYDAYQVILKLVNDQNT